MTETSRTDIISLAVNLATKVDATNLSEAFESIYAVLKDLRDEEEVKLRVAVQDVTIQSIPEKKSRKVGKITCPVCQKKLVSFAGKHLKTHGLKLADLNLPKNGQEENLHASS